MAGVRGRVETPLRPSNSGSLQLLPPRVLLTSPVVAVNPSTFATLSWSVDVLGETAPGGPADGMWSAAVPTRISIMDKGLYRAVLQLSTTAGTALRDRGVTMTVTRGGTPIMSVAADSLSRADGGATVTTVEYAGLNLIVGDALTFQFAHLMAAAVNMSAFVYVEKIGS